MHSIRDSMKTFHQIQTHYWYHHKSPHYHLMSYPSNFNYICFFERNTQLIQNINLTGNAFYDTNQLNLKQQASTVSSVREEQNTKSTNIAIENIKYSQEKIQLEQLAQCSPVGKAVATFMRSLTSRKLKLARLPFPFLNFFSIPQIKPPLQPSLGIKGLCVQ